ncbi:response regulator FixJ [Caulobacter sp. NIBR2454]|uniref:response regulator FixJ n=1 Tax=Caulobacter sp. NIBR2454 TaxID=3015996 RepID=UPI0022B65AAA|nr:response regulator FixJ [Caulobacter sp. NIBR2454]
MSSNVQVHVIDDDDAMRDSLCFLFETSGLVAQAYPSAVAFIEAMPHVGGCIVTDIRMPEMTGLELVRMLRVMGSTLPVVVMTGHGDVPLAVEAMKAGVIDFLEKPFREETMISAVMSALKSGEETARRDAMRDGVLARRDQLAPRERQVLDALVDGKANKVIAHEMGISARTVEIYRANVMTKMQAASLSELVRMVLLASPQ